MKRLSKMSHLRFMNKIIITLLLLASTVVSHAQYDKGVVIDKIIAKVDDYIVLKSELEQSYLDFLASGELNTGNAKCQIFESLIINKLLIAKAEIDSVIVSDSEVYSNLDRRMQYFISQIGSEEAIEEFYGKSIDEFRDELFQDIKEQLTVQKMRDEITKDTEVSPAEVRRFFSRIPKDSLPYFSSEVTIGQIVKIPDVSNEQKLQVRKRLMNIRERILNGEEFGALAKEFSMDPGSASSGGNLGFFKRGELAPEFEATAMSLKPGELSMPVETDFGFHLIQLIERRGNSFNSRHILIIPNSSDNDVVLAKEYLDSLKLSIQNDSITFSKAAKEYSDDQMTASSGGFFTDPSGANRISVEELDPTVFFAIDTMEVGSISPPMEYRMQDGTEAVRIIYYKDRIAPHQAELEQDYQKIYAATKAQKRNRILSEWFNEAQGDVYINIDPEYDYCNILKQPN